MSDAARNEPMPRTLIIETGRGVLEVRLRRGPPVRPGVRRWRLEMRVLSGPPLTRGQAARLVAELAARGLNVVGWRAGRDPRKPPLDPDAPAPPDGD
jgi:hypothetical protein